MKIDNKFHSLAKWIKHLRLRPGEMDKNLKYL
jgi:hypothetical protein